MSYCVGEAGKSVVMDADQSTASRTSFFKAPAAVIEEVPVEEKEKVKSESSSDVSSSSSSDSEKDVRSKTEKISKKKKKRNKKKEKKLSKKDKLAKVCATRIYLFYKWKSVFLLKNYKI